MIPTVQKLIAAMFGKKPAGYAPKKLTPVLAVDPIQVAAHGLAVDEFHRLVARGQDPDFDDLWDKHAARIAERFGADDTPKQ